jgi:hypothetical protein
MNEIEIEDFYSLPTLRIISKAISFLLTNDFLNEITNINSLNYNSIENIERVNANSKLEIRIVKEKRKGIGTKKEIRQWILGSVWYVNQPVMIIRNKEYFPYDTLPKHFITNVSIHKEMLGYIFSLLKPTKIQDLSYDPGSFDTRLLYGDDTLDSLQVINQPEVYDLNKAKEAINKL